MVTDKSTHEHYQDTLSVEISKLTREAVNCDIIYQTVYIYIL